MRKKGKVYRKLWFWLVIILVVILIIFFFPKSCGGSGNVTLGSLTSINCDCFGIKGPSIIQPSIMGASFISCYGICIDSNCKKTITPPLTPPVEEPVQNNTTTNGTITPEVNPLPYTTNTNVELSKSLRFTIKPANPQFKKGQDITILYTIENIDNKTIILTPVIESGVEVKNAGNKVINYSGSGSNVRIITDSLGIESGKRESGNFVIKSDDYNFYSNGDIGNGYYNTITAYIGTLKSNRVIVRFI
jgi:hypothetical protein